MGVLDSLSPSQRQLVMYGAPVAAVAGLLAARRKSTAPPVVTMPPANPDAVGVGDLASFQNNMSDVLGTLSQAIYDLENRPSPTPGATKPPSNQNPAPVTAPRVTTVTTVPMTWLRSAPTGDAAHDEAIKDPAVSAYLEYHYRTTSKPTGDAAHDEAIKDPAVSAYLQGLWLAQQGK
jgi:hypothetical protein